MFLGQYPTLAFSNQTDYTKPRKVGEKMPRSMESLYGVPCPECVKVGEQNQIGFSVRYGISCERSRSWHTFTEEELDAIRALAESTKTGPEASPKSSDILSS